MFIALLLIACSGAPAPAAEAPQRPAIVAVAAARDGRLSDTWTILGDVRALERAELAAGASGAVESVAAREGDRVAAGQVLVQIDPALARAEVSAAVAERERLAVEVAQARTTQARVGRVDSGVLAASELEQVATRVASLEAQLTGAKAMVSLASARLQRHRVTAPFDGVVTRRHVDPGDWVNPGTPALDVVRSDRVEVHVAAPLDLAWRVQVGDSVTLGATHGATGHVVGVVPALDPVSRTAVIRVEPDTLVEGMVPGSPIDVSFNVQMTGGLVVPRDAVVPSGTSDRVFRVIESTAEALEVHVIASTADEVMVTSDVLRAGDQLVVRGNERLREGQSVQVGP